MKLKRGFFAVALMVCAMTVPLAFARTTPQATTGSIKGKVSLEEQQVPVHNVIVVITQLKLSATTNDQGEYEIKNVPPGTYSLIARVDRMPDVPAQRVEVIAGQATTVDFQLKLTGVREQVTVSATGDAQSALESFQGVTGVDATTLIERAPTSLGDALEHETGVAKRSSGPGAGRPVIRGFDGDRVMVAQDGIRTGSLSYSSGDHGEPINVLSVERVEVVRGPGTLLYGSSAIGGIVNTVSGHEQAHEGIHGFFTGIGGTTNALGGASGGIEYGTKHWLFWANGGGQRTGDYQTPVRRVLNSQTQSKDVTGGVGYFGDKAFLSGSYSFNKNKYGVPLDPAEPNSEIIALDPQRHNVRLNGGFNQLSGSFDHVHLTFDFSDYKHNELNDGVPETRFFNKTYSYRVIAEQRHSPRYSGTIGLSGFRRDYSVLGEEALVPPTKQDSFAVFVLEGIDLKRIAFQFGARLEHNAYDTTPSAARRNRDFTGFSGSAGARIPLWEGGSLSGYYSHSYRAPSLDELYNLGPHPGNLTFEIGNTDLQREASDGVDVSFHQTFNKDGHNLRAEAHYFYYKLRDFIYLAPTGAVDDGLQVAKYLQGDSRFTGAELNLSAGLNQYVTLTAGLDYVSARLTATDLPLPRIPPLRGRFGVDFNYKGFRLNPEVIATRRQDAVFINETPTAGYGLFNLLGSYTFAQKHAAHIFSVSSFNLTDKEYYNHLSFLKAFVPEIGRGMRVSYTVRFF